MRCPRPEPPPPTTENHFTAMSDSACCSPAWKRAVAAVLGVAGTAAVLGFLALHVFHSNQVAPVGAARAAERSRLQRDLQGSNTEVLGSYGIVKAENGVYRLPIARAQEVLATEWKDGNAAGRAKLIQRLEASLKAPTFE